MSPIDPTSSLGSTSPLTPPPGVTLETPEQQQMYRVSLEFERFFVQQLLKPMENAGTSVPGADESDSSGSTSGYQDLAQDQLTQSVLDGGGLGLAATLYGQMAEAAGISTKPVAKAPGTPTGGAAA
ncbi:MAG: hypothetical protein JWM86_1532 [Thermoleophilia bacterium]|nr:hypothetical protein [Thermoleophilia bacterium]